MRRAGYRHRGGRQVPALQAVLPLNNLDTNQVSYHDYHVDYHFLYWKTLNWSWLFITEVSGIFSPFFTDGFAMTASASHS